MGLTNAPSPYSEAPTEWLTRQAVAGDRDARDEIVQRTMQPLLAWFAVHIRASRAFRAEPQECVNEVWMRALSRLGKLDPDAGNIRLWLFGIARNVLNEHRHHAMRREAGRGDGMATEQTVSTLEDSITRVSEVMARSEQHQILTTLIQTLDTEDSLLITCHGLERRPLAEAAEKLGITRDAAAKRWQRLLALMRERGINMGLFEPDV
jgi:RNA polymerase sigma factor (sigma-70 family)